MQNTMCIYRFLSRFIGDINLGSMSSPIKIIHFTCKQSVLLKTAINSLLSPIYILSFVTNLSTAIKLLLNSIFLIICVMRHLLQVPVLKQSFDPYQLILYVKLYLFVLTTFICLGCDLCFFLDFGEFIHL